MQATLRIPLKKDEEKDFRKGSPWVFQHQLDDSILASARPGELAQLLDAEGAPLGLGLLSPNSLIAWREVQRGPQDHLPDGWLLKRLHTALIIRQKRFDAPYFRLVHAESDGLPGLIIDRFGEILVAQATIAGMELLWPEIQSALLSLMPDASILLRNDTAYRAMEGLAEEVRLITGEVPPRIELEEYGVKFLADLWQGPKTGWQYAQRDNRAMAALHAKGKSILDLYAHSGGFGIPAAVAGAESVLLVDASERALELAEKAAQRNGVADRVHTRQGDTLEILEALAAEHARFDHVIADPPAFLLTRENLPQGLHSYERISRLAASILNPGGQLTICSNSPYCSPNQLRHAAQTGIQRAGKTGLLVRMTGASADCPPHPHVPQTSALHCAWFTIG